MAQHAKYSPSTLDNLSKCIRFKYSECNAGAADEGTELHKAFETGNLDGLNDEQRQTVEKVLGYTLSLRGSEPAAWSDGTEVHVELRGLTYGTADRVLLNADCTEAHILDAKFGRIGAEHDFQIRTYAAALVERYPTLKKVTTHIVSPRTDTIEITVHDDPAKLLEDTRRDIEALYERIEDPFNSPTPHEDLCSKCARASRCPAVGAVVLASASKLGLPLPSEFRPEAPVSNRDRAIAQVLAGVLINWGDQVKKFNSKFVSSGGTIEGFRLVRRSTGLRVPPEMTEAAISCLNHAGISREIIMAHTSLTLGDIIKSHAENTGMLESEVKERVRSCLGDLATESSTVFLQKAQRSISDTDLMKQIQAGS